MERCGCMAEKSVSLRGTSIRNVPLDLWCLILCRFSPHPLTAISNLSRSCRCLHAVVTSSRSMLWRFLLLEWLNIRRKNFSWSEEFKNCFTVYSMIMDGFRGEVHGERRSERIAVDAIVPTASTSTNRDQWTWRRCVLHWLFHLGHRCALCCRAPDHHNVPFHALDGCSNFSNSRKEKNDFVSRKTVRKQQDVPFSVAVHSDVVSEQVSRLSQFPFLDCSVCDVCVKVHFSKVEPRFPGRIFIIGRRRMRIRGLAEQFGVQRCSADDAVLFPPDPMGFLEWNLRQP